MEDVEPVTESRALITQTEREHLTGENGDDKKYQSTSRIRRRIQTELVNDIEHLEQHHPELFTELKDTVCDTHPTNNRVETLIKKLTPTTKTNAVLENIPTESELTEYYDTLLYSSSMVTQTYMQLFNQYKPADASDRYQAAAVLQQRELGTGVIPYTPDTTTTNTTDSTPTDNDLPTVYRVTGELTIKTNTDETDIKSTEVSDEMFVNKFTTNETTFIDYGSTENYHPIVQQHVTDNTDFTAQPAVGYFIELSPETTENGNVHFMQLALNN